MPFGAALHRSASPGSQRLFCYDAGWPFIKNRGPSDSSTTSKHPEVLGLQQTDLRPAYEGTPFLINSSDVFPESPLSEAGALANMFILKSVNKADKLLRFPLAALGDLRYDNFNPCSRPRPHARKYMNKRSRS